MNNSIEINNNTYAIGYYPATITHSDKYGERNFFAVSSYFNYTPKHDIAFKTTRTGEECFFTLSYSNIRATIGQEVSLIVLDKYVIGYVNNSSNDYYYLTNQFVQLLGLGVDWKWILLIEILLGIGIFLSQYYLQTYLVLSFLVVPITYWITMRLYNLYLEKKIDKVVRNG
jgi:hypothetical protein